MHWTDEQIDQMLGKLLRAGVMLAAAVVLTGGLLYMIKYGAAQPNYHIFHGEPADLRSVAGILADARALRSRGVIQLGLLLLIATPIARTLFGRRLCLTARSHLCDRYHDCVERTAL
ncbi:MAG: DUF1634 domain-containing protein [Caldilineaceae bacterium]